MIDEISALRRIEEQFNKKTNGIELGIGDDAAAVNFTAGRIVLATTDSQVEDVHFVKSQISPQELARKAIAVSVSDVAAMGGVARYILSSVGFSESEDKNYLEELISGFTSSLEEFEVELVGGNLSSSDKLFLDITVLGEVEPDLMVKRSGASPGERIFVSGTLGDSALGFEILQAQNKTNTNDFLINRHLNPSPRLALGRELALKTVATSMIDISDGLALDIERITVHQGLGGIIELQQLPISEQYNECVDKFSDDKYELALSGGEDYELLFTSPEDKRQDIKQISEDLKIQLTEIGYVTNSKSLDLVNIDGEKINLKQRGFVHFNN